MKYNDTHGQSSTIHTDELSTFLQKLTIRVNSFGTWSTTIPKQARYTLEDIELIFIKQGGGLTTILGVNYEYSQHDLLVLQPYQLYKSKALGNTAYNYLHFDIEPSIYQDTFLDLLQHHVYKLKDKTHLIEIFDAIISELNTQRLGFTEMMNTLIKQLFILLIRVGPNDIIPPKTTITGNSSQETLVEKCVDYIVRNLKEDCTVASLSKRFNVSENYLYKNFMRYLEQSPSQFVLSMRIYRAKSLIVANTLSMEEVANAVGFSSLSHFSRSFKQKEGASPSEFKKAYADSNKVA